MASDRTGRRNSNTQLLEELEALSQSLYQSHTSATTTRRTASLVLPRTSFPPISSSTGEFSSSKNVDSLNPKPRSRRMSLSPWRSRPKQDDGHQIQKQAAAASRKEFKLEDKTTAYLEKKGLWNWKPIRALSHIGMQKLSCLLSVEVVTVQNLPPSMNGLRLSVCVRKKETKDGAVQTMPSRVSQGAADFEETLFLRCHVYCNQGSQFKFEPRPFLVYVFAVDAAELDFGKHVVDLSLLIQESIDRSQEGTRVRQWDTSFNLSGKAKGGELVLKVGFQVMEKDGGTGIYSQSPEGVKSGKGRDVSSIFGRRQSKTSFSVPSPRLNSRSEAWTPSQAVSAVDLQGIDVLDLNDPVPPAPNPPEPESKADDLDMPDFDIVDKGVEIQNKYDKDDDKGQQVEEHSDDKRSVSSEEVKEIVHDHAHLTRLTELDSIAQQLKALESMMGSDLTGRTDEEMKPQRLDAEEETVTREFLEMLENQEVPEYKINIQKAEKAAVSKGKDKVFVPYLGKNLGCVVQTRNGGYFAAMNPLDTAMSKKDTPKLAMQLSKPFVLPGTDSISGFELFQSMAAVGLERLGSEISSLMPIDELRGKTAEQIALEGIAWAIIQGRNKEGPSDSAARSIAAVKSMIAAMGCGRKERISTGIFNLPEEPLTVDEILAFSMQKIEVMAVEALKIQADMAEEDAPFDVSPLSAKTVADGKGHPLESAVPLGTWMKGGYVGVDQTGSNSEVMTISVLVQLRDPLRQYETVGGPLVALIHAADEGSNEEKRFRVASLHVGGIRSRNKGNKMSWDSEKQRLSAMQWLVAYGIGKGGGSKGKRVLTKQQQQQQQQQQQDYLWSISSRVVAGMWLKHMRNPNVKFTK